MGGVPRRSLDSVFVLQFPVQGTCRRRLGGLKPLFQTSNYWRS